MVLRERREPKVPAYVLEWVGKRVSWYDRPRHLAGIVIEAQQHLVDHHPETLLRIARDDGFIAIGVDARRCSKEGPE